MTKRAFTLVELLVVVGIIASMATVSIGSYFAVVRGMADRGALAGATSVISMAQERARIDLSPTVGYFYNELVQVKDDTKGTARVAAGVAIAVRRAGRISRVDGDALVDEFADLDRTYGLADGMNATQSDTFRLYHFNLSQMEYSSVYSEAVEVYTGNEKYLVEHPADRNFNTSSGESDNGNKMFAYAFRRKSGYSGWRAGDAYGYEFTKIRLADNYIFGSASAEPTEAEPVKVVSKVIKCYPNSDVGSLDTVEILNKKPNGGWRKVGDTKSEMKDI